MQKYLVFKKLRVYAFVAFFAYAVSISLAAVQYLPYQIYAAGIFKTYTINEADYYLFAVTALVSALIIPSKIEKPSDWFLMIFIIFLLLPGLTLGVISDELGYEKKLTLLPTLVVSILMIYIAGSINLKKFRQNEKKPISKSIMHIGLIGWLISFALLVGKHHSEMRFSGLDNIYEQRAITGSVGSFFGYVQLYFTYVFCTLLIAYGVTIKKWLWVAIGSAGYFVMYLITAEKSVVMLPFFLIGVGYLAKSKKPALEIIVWVIAVVSIIIFGVIYLSEDNSFFDFVGFYLFTRLIATPSQFILDYYEFFSNNGFTFFSQIKGFNFFVDAPAQYASNPKWPQLGWIVGAGSHGIESNSNATFIATDGAASFGALGIIFVSALLCLYLFVINKLSEKIHMTFWSIIFAQQALNLISGSLFSLMLSFGGFFYLILFTLYQPGRLKK